MELFSNKIVRICNNICGNNIVGIIYQLNIQFYIQKIYVLKKKMNYQHCHLNAH